MVAAWTASTTPMIDTSAVSFCSEMKSFNNGGMTVRTAWGRMTRRIVVTFVRPSDLAAMICPLGTE